MVKRATASTQFPSRKPTADSKSGHQSFWRSIQRQSKKYTAISQRTYELSISNMIWITCPSSRLAACCEITVYTSRNVSNLFVREPHYIRSRGRLRNRRRIISVLFLFWKNKSRLMRSPSCLCIPLPHPIIFWMREPTFMKLGMYIMAPEPISVAYFINPISLCICTCIPPIVIPRSRGNDYKIQRNAWRVVFYAVRVVSKERMWLGLTKTFINLAPHACYISLPSHSLIWSL
jgi:hypothetical protein